MYIESAVRVLALSLLCGINSSPSGKVIGPDSQLTKMVRSEKGNPFLEGLRIVEGGYAFYFLNYPRMCSGCRVLDTMETPWLWAAVTLDGFESTEEVRALVRATTWVLVSRHNDRINCSVNVIGGERAVRERIIEQARTSVDVSCEKIWTLAPINSLGKEHVGLAKIYFDEKPFNEADGGPPPSIEP